MCDYGVKIAKEPLNKMQFFDMTMFEFSIPTIAKIQKEAKKRKEETLERHNCL